MTEQKIQFKASAYLEKSYLDKDGSKHITFAFTIKDALEIAKLELMGRDLIEHRPVLLDLSIKKAEEITQKYDNEEKRPQVKRRKFKG